VTRACVVQRFAAASDTPFRLRADRLHGQYSGYSGAAYYGNWLASPWYQLATTATVWVSVCSSFDTVAGVATLDVNGQPSTTKLAGLLIPDRLTVNGNLPSQNSQWSAFGVAELMVWNRALTAQQLVAAQTYLTRKYGLLLKAPPTPPTPVQPPPSPNPPPPPTPPAPSVPAIAARAATPEAYVSWSQQSFNAANWYMGYEGSNAALFQSNTPFKAFSGQPGTASTFGLTNGAGQAASLIVNAGNGLPFTTSALCNKAYAGFSLTFAITITAGSASYNSMADGVSIAFINAATAASATTIAWAEDANGVLTPTAAGSVTLEVDTCASDAHLRCALVMRCARRNARAGDKRCVAAC
jgi:hypothetical protein